MKRFLKYLFILLIIIMPFNICAETTDFIDEVNSSEVIRHSSGEYELVIKDTAGLLSEEEKIKLQDDMTPLLEYGNIAFYTVDGDNTSAHSKASSFYSINFGAESGTVFLIDMKIREIYIYSYGSNSYVITNMKSNTITDNVFRYASDGDYYLCAKEAFNQMNRLLMGKKISEPLKYFTSALCAIITSVFGCFIYAYLTSKKKILSINKLAANSQSSFKLSNISARVTGEKRVYSPQSDYSSSGGGGGGSFGGGGGGGGHSSGGGHRF